MGSGRVRLISVRYKINSKGRQRKVYGGLAMKDITMKQRKYLAILEYIKLYVIVADILKLSRITKRQKFEIPYK